MPEDSLNKIAKQAQDYYKDVPVIILGSGASAGYGMPGMWALGQHLVEDISTDDIANNDHDSWKEFCSFLKNGIDLESALHKVPLSPEIIEKVVISTWNLLVPEDLSIFNKSLRNNELFVLGKLLRHMFRSTSRHINIITPNYDRLAEYACEQENIHHYSGFSYGFRRNIVEKDYLTCSRQVNIWKVHGSLDWFVNTHGVISGFGNINKIPEGFKPLIVTPGIEKYRNTHREPFKSTIHEADDIFDDATSYLCVGFGFNDEHIQTKLVNHCSKRDAKIIIITRTLSESAHLFLSKGNARNYLAIESGDEENTSIIHSSLHKDPVILNGNYWELAGFINLIM